MRINNRSLFKVRSNKAKNPPKNQDNEATIYIYDEISWWGIEAQQFAEELKAIDAKTVNIRINSPGGNVFDGTAIANAIKQHKSKTVIHIDGLAASIASIVALSGDEIRMAENAFFMFHEAWSMTVGNADDMREEADLLDKVDGMLVNTYAKKTGKEDKEIKDLMRAETWLTAEEALEMGMIDVIEDVSEEEAKAPIYDLSAFANVPKELQGIKKDFTKRDLENALRDVGCSQHQAKEILATGFVAEDSQRDVDDNQSNQDDRDDQNDNDDHQRDVEQPKLKKDRTAELLTRGEVLAPTRYSN